MNRIDFYQMVGSKLRRYLPVGYQEYQTHIKEAEISGKKYALLILEKEDVKIMPVLSLEPYLERVEGGMDENAVLIDAAVDYAKMVSLQNRGQCRQMER